MTPAFLIFDTETTGLPRDYNAPLTDFDNWPRLVQLAWQLHDASGNLLDQCCVIIKPEGFSIPFGSAKIHGITTERALAEGIPLSEALELFYEALKTTTYVAGHNIEFDLNVVGCEFLRNGHSNLLENYPSLDTKELSTQYCAIPGGKGGKFKWPTLNELHFKLFGSPFQEAHDAAYDVSATGKCFFELIKRHVFNVAEIPDIDAITYVAPELEKSNFQVQAEKAKTLPVSPTVISSVATENLSLPLETDFVHLHVHSQFSILQSTSEIGQLVKKALALNMTALAITDHGNMMAAFQFVTTANKAKLKAITGIEINICRNHIDKSAKDDGHPTVLFAKNKIGYHALAQMSSISYTSGFYYVPRIDKEILLKFKEHIMVTTGGLWSEVPWLILNVGEEKAEEAFCWWKDHFGENFYAELNRHGLEEEDVVNKVLLRFCVKYDVKYFAANNTYYTNREDAEAQDALICVKEGEYVSRPSKYVGKSGRENRFGFPNNEFYFKTPAEMATLFADLPESLQTTKEIADKCESYSLASDVLLPKFEIPLSFDQKKEFPEIEESDENAFLRYLTYQGAKTRYGDVTIELKERLDFELATIAKTGYPGYFLIVQDFCAEARRRGVSVGPGRGSAAGSAVAYCIGITNIDPIRYNLLFERFLNPERVSMPDIDIDFDDEGRDRVIDYVREKYGANMVAQIITYGTMAAKSSIRDAGRVFELPLPDTDRLAKLMPDSDLKEMLLWDDKKLGEELGGEDFQNAKKLREIAKSDSHEGKVIRMASLIEGSVRNTGIHACGIIITPNDITQYVPVALAKDSNMWCTQFDNAVVESAGLLKMDFLGLKTLTLIRDTVKLVKETRLVDIDIEQIPLDDEKTFQLFQRGETVGIFQYESDGMRKYLRELKPTVIDDLIAMNALYRPGPLEYIPKFVARKHGREEITYDLPEMEEFLKDTYGICVYQEQVMLLSQKLAGFTKGQADVLRKAMGKKQKDVLDKMKDQFMTGAKSLGHPEEKLEKIWTDWEAFASYAFNKSHSTCYAWIAYQTAYLKAHFPAEYMAAVLSNNMGDLKQVTFFMQECRKQGIPVLGPDVNESKSLFSVNAKGEIRFGLAAIKGMGENAVESIVSEQKDGPFKNIYDFLKRVDSKATGKKAIESCVLAGALDAFGISRAAFFAPDGKSESFIESLVKYASSVRDNRNSQQVSLFGDASEVALADPLPPTVEPWDTLTQLSKEKEVVGMFISGHPLDDFGLELRSFCSDGNLSLLTNLEVYKNRELKVAGMVTAFTHKVSKANNKPFGTFTLEDFDSSFEFILFGEDYLKYRHLMQGGEKLWIQGRVQQRKYGQSDGWEFRVVKIEPLFEIREKMGKFLDISFSLNQLNDALIDQLHSSLKNGSGRTQVRLRILADDGPLVLNSGSFNKVSITAESLNQLEKVEGIEFAVLEA